MKKMCLRKTVSFLLVLSMIMALAGCGSGDSTAPGSGADTDSGIDGSGNMDPVSGDVGDAESDTAAAMGRYVEKELDLTEFLANSDGNRGLRRRLDGSLVILSTISGLVVSEDEGATWQAEAPDWFQAMKQEEKYIIDMDMAADGTTAVLYNSGGVEEYAPAMMLVLPDGTQVPVEAELTEEESSFSTLAVSEEGRIIAGTASETLYEIHTDGSAEKYLTVEERPQWMKIQDGLLFMDSEVGDMPVIFDMEAEVWVEDDVLQEFAAANYGSRYYNGYTFQNMYLLPGEEQTVYTIGGKGIHRHVIGGNMMEQIVDGNLSMLSNPNYTINSAIRLEGDEFLVLFANCKLMRFTYDPDAPAVPENMLKVYSLRESDDMRKAIAGFQSQNPDSFISYEVGMPEGAAVTREDALKKLNTQIMAGTGPDLLIMDDLPIRSYVEKGLLADLTEYLAQYSVENALYDPIINTMKIDGKAYMAPATVSLPVLVGEEQYVSNVTSLSDLADRIEAKRKADPGQDIIGMISERGVLKRFVPVSAPTWIDGDGRIDRQALGEFLEQCKRIHGVQMEGLAADAIAKYGERDANLLAYYGMDADLLEWRVTHDFFEVLTGEMAMASGWVESAADWREVVSINRADGFQQYAAAEMKGQCSGVFRPNTLLALSAASGKKDAAMRFFDYFLSAQAQSSYDGLPVNQEAFDIQFTPQEEYLAEDGGYSYLSMSSQDGTRLEYVVYWPDDEQILALKEQLGHLQTAYLPDSVLEDAVFEQGVAYMQGKLSLEQALDGIEQKVSIYMAE